jgi:hypothetical protein
MKLKVLAMEAVRVRYTVKPEYVDHNKENIRKVMEEVRSLNPEGLKYSTFQLEDKVTFIHIAMFDDTDSRKILGTLESFQKFQKELKDSEPDSPPQPIDLHLVGSSYDIF